MNDAKYGYNVLDNDLRFADRKWTGRIRLFEITSLRMNQNTGGIKGVNLLEE